MTLLLYFSVNTKLLKQSTFHKETRDEGMSAGLTRGRESGVHPVLAARFGSVSDRLSGQIHAIME
ncbi:MAG: hypothetical protein U9Q37_06060 [Euryarchaeota archaeon]|nr:hypothetical protein [Euryarchaeota archaeon]